MLCICDWLNGFSLQEAEDPALDDADGGMPDTACPEVVCLEVACPEIACPDVVITDLAELDATDVPSPATSILPRISRCMLQ